MGSQEADKNPINGTCAKCCFLGISTNQLLAEIPKKQHLAHVPLIGFLSASCECHCFCLSSARNWYKLCMIRGCAVVIWMCCKSKPLLSCDSDRVCKSSARNWYKLWMLRGCAVVIWMCCKSNPFGQGQKFDCLKFHVGTRQISFLVKIVSSLSSFFLRFLRKLLVLRL